MTRVIESPQLLLGLVGEQLRPTTWLTIDQQRIDAFAAATGDYQWIHVDPVRAAAGPFGATIAHGYLTLSLVSLFLPQLMTVNGTAMGINYGTNRVRFPAAVRVGSRVRARGEIIEAQRVQDGAVQIVTRVSIDIENSDKPACVAEVISRFYPAEVRTA